MKWKFMGALGMVLILLPALARADQLPPPGYPLSWYDEFNGQSLDTTKWGYGMKPWGTTDNSPCLITPEDTYLQNGDLVLRDRMGNFGQYHYSCGWAWTKKWFKYGYFEMRAKYPKGNGQWPAWWMLKQGWPPEIDIAEYRGTPLNYMTEAFYWGQWSTTLLHESSGWDFSAWHTYGLRWGPGYLIWYVDGQIEKYYFGNQVPTDSMYVIFSAGLDGSSADSATGFPNYYTIDYFRYYQMPGSDTCSPTPIIPSVQLNFGTWQIADSISAKPGDFVSLSVEPTTGGTWSWSGGGTSGSSSQQYITVSKSCTITATFVNSCGDTSTENFYVVVEPTGVKEGAISQGGYNLSQNYPNPFNPATEISYRLLESANVTIDIYDVDGRKVRTLVDIYQSPGEHSVSWNSLDDHGNVVPSGTYFYKIVATYQNGSWSKTKKMVLLK